MMVPRLTVQVESDYDRDPFLTEGSIDFHEHEHDHVIDVTNCDYTSASSSQGGYNSSHEARNEDWTLTSSLANASRLSTSTTTYSRSASLRRSGETHGQRRRNLLDSRLCISVLLLANVVQIFTAVAVLSFSRHEHTRAPLFAWVIGYTVGCIANLPRLYYRYIHPNYQDFDQEPAPITTSVSRVDQNNIFVSSRPSALIGHFKVGLECFFVVWFVVGNVWVFGSGSSTADAPNLYRLCIAFLALSCIGYAMPFILCVTICCCFPCLISFLGFRENLPLPKGATSELINALPTYKFKSQRSQNRGSSQTREESFEGGILAVGTDKERIVSPEDAVCCICLAAYAENDSLRELPCTHFFHAYCVDKWLKINGLCPLWNGGANSNSIHPSAWTDELYLRRASVQALQLPSRSQLKVKNTHILTQKLHSRCILKQIHFDLQHY